MDPRLRVVLYTLDEYTFSRELAPLAGGYPALYLGAPWWFLDSPDGLRRFREAVTETAGFYNTAGFVDDTRAFCSIPVRHDVARRVDAAYLASLVAQDRLPLDEAAETIADLAYHLPKRIFRLDGSTSMTTITEVEVHDVRFPTAAAGDGSDAINRGDYSATYVELITDGPLTGAGFTFTNGRGNEITCAAVRALAHHVVGRTLAELAADRLAFSRSLIADVQLRWLGPEKGVLHMATGALVNAVWDLWAKAGRQAAVAVPRRTAHRGAGRRRRLPPHQRRAHARARRPRSWTRAASGWRTGWRCCRATASRRTPPAWAGSATPTTRCGR